MTYVLVAIAVYVFAVLLGLTFCIAASRADRLLESEKVDPEANFRTSEENRGVA